MTTATEATLDNQFLDFDVPEELAERSFTSVMRVLGAGAQMPPQKKAAKIIASGAEVRPEFHIILEPLSYRNRSDKSFGFEDEYEHVWVPIYDRDGKLASAESMFGQLKARFLKLGFTITNKESAASLTGKVFTFENKRIDRQFAKRDADGKVIKDAEGKTVYEQDAKPNWLWLPVDRGDDNYVFQGVLPVVDRPRKKTGQTPNAAAIAGNESEAYPVLMEVLNGLTEGEYMGAIVTSKNPAILRTPYTTEAASNPAAITERMLSVGMRVVDGRLVKP